MRARARCVCVCVCASAAPIDGQYFTWLELHLKIKAKRSGHDTQTGSQTGAVEFFLQ